MHVYWFFCFQAHDIDHWSIVCSVPRVSFGLSFFAFVAPPPALSDLFGADAPLPIDFGVVALVF